MKKKYVVGLLIFTSMALIVLWRLDLPIFWINALKKPTTVGALMPSGSAVGHELTRYIVKSQHEKPFHPLNILEVGAGTGSVTHVIIDHMRPLDRLDVIEISSEFCSVLHDKYDTYPHVSIHCMSILDWQPEQHYDFIISTLPFNSFDYELMNSIIVRLMSLIKPQGIVSYISFTGIAQLQKLFLWGDLRSEHIHKMNRLKLLRNYYQIAEKTILMNLPPITVYHLCISDSSS